MKKKIVILLLLLLKTSENAFGYGYLKEKGKGSIDYTGIIRGDKTNDGARNDITFKYGINNYINYKFETSILVASNSNKYSAIGLNYLKTGGSVALYKGEKVGISIGYDIAYGNEWASRDGIVDYLYTHKGLKQTANIGLDWKIDDEFKLLTDFEYRRYHDNGVDRYRILIELKDKLDDNWTSHYMIWNALHNVKEKNWTILEAGITRKINKNMSVGLYVSYYIRHNASQFSFRNFSFIPVFSYSF